MHLDQTAIRRGYNNLAIRLRERLYPSRNDGTEQPVQGYFSGANLVRRLDVCLATHRSQETVEVRPQRPWRSGTGPSGMIGTPCWRGLRLSCSGRFTPAVQVVRIGPVNCSTRRADVNGNLRPICRGGRNSLSLGACPFCLLRFRGFGLLSGAFRSASGRSGANSGSFQVGFSEMDSAR